MRMQIYLECKGVSYLPPGRLSLSKACVSQAGGRIGLPLRSGMDGGSRSSSGDETARRPAAISKPVLELQSWHWSTEHGVAIAEGLVKNISDQKLKNVEVVVMFVDSNGDFITTGEALIEYNPILPGQTSPFKAMATANPAPGKAQIDFKTLFGGSLRWRKK